MVRIASKACLTTTPQSGKEFRVKFKAIAVAALSAAIICGAPAHADEVVVSAASSLTNAFKAAGQQYEHQHPDTKILFSFRSEEHTSELQSLMRISYAVFCLKKKNN